MKKPSVLGVPLRKQRRALGYAGTVAPGVRVTLQAGTFGVDGFVEAGGECAYLGAPPRLVVLGTEGHHTEAAEARVTRFLRGLGLKEKPCLSGFHPKLSDD